ncbi:MAG: hypothetical protein J2P46_22900, partial [Zavarzinella sp.]|nr:hypothetical protein [Zavarzinella sp.]
TPPPSTGASTAPVPPAAPPAAELQGHRPRRLGDHHSLSSLSAAVIRCTDEFGGAYLLEYVIEG